MGYSRKDYKLNDCFSVACITHEPTLFRGKTYDVIVYLNNVPWEEVVQKYEGIDKPDKANRIFKDMINRYKNK